MGGGEPVNVVECPRCGYDLSGTVRAWERECPLAGECSECSLGIEWRDLLNPLRVVPAWSFEHAHGKRVRRLARTAVVCLWPRKLWRELRMEHPVVGRRLAVFGVFLIGLLHAACAAASMSLMAGVMLNQAWLRITWRQRLAWPWSDPPDSGSYLGNALVTPGPGGIDPMRFAAAGIWPYGNPVVGVPWLFVAILWCGLVPIAFVALPDTLRQCRVRRAHLVRGLVYSLPWMALIIGFGFVARTVGYGGWHLGGGGWGSGGRSTGSIYLEMLIDLVETAAPHPAICLGLVGLALWAHWGWMVRRYLRLPHAAAVAAAMLVMSGMAAMLVGLAVNWNYFGEQLG